MDTARQERTDELNTMIDEHGLIKMAHACMLSIEGLRQSASEVSPRVVSQATLVLASYRLKDRVVWKADDWVDVQDVAKIQRDEKTKVEKARRHKVRDAKVRPPAK